MAMLRDLFDPTYDGIYVNDTDIFQQVKDYVGLIAPDKQAGLCKTNLVDTASDPVGLWTSKVLNPAATKKVSDWVRNANYKAFCDALSGE